MSFDLARVRMDLDSELPHVETDLFDSVHDFDFALADDHRILCTTSPRITASLIDLASKHYCATHAWRRALLATHTRFTSLRALAVDNTSLGEMARNAAPNSIIAIHEHVIKSLPSKHYCATHAWRRALRATHYILSYTHSIAAKIFHTKRKYNAHAQCT